MLEYLPYFILTVTGLFHTLHRIHLSFHPLGVEPSTYIENVQKHDIVRERKSYVTGCY